MKDMVDRAHISRFTVGGLGIIFAVCFVLNSILIGYASEPQTPIKIGILYPLTGTYAFLGKRQLRGWEVALEMVNYKVAGRPIKLIVEDDESNPSVGLDKTVKLIERDRVCVLGGIVSSAVAYAIRDTVERSRVPLIITMSGAAGLTQEKRSPFVFRVIQPSTSPPHYMAQFLYEELKLRKAVTSSNDYSYGRECLSAFKKEFERLGGEVLFENFAPLGTPDFGPYCTKLANFTGKADVLFFVHSGAEAIRFIKAVEEFGLKKTFVIANWGGMEEGSELNQAGSAAEGLYTIAIYFFGIKTQANQIFQEHVKRKGEGVDIRNFYGYLAAQVVLNAINKVKGKVEATDEFLRALRDVQLESASGPIRFDPRSQNILQNLYISQVRKVEGEFGKFQNVILKTIPQAQDPWWVGRQR